MSGFEYDDQVSFLFFAQHIDATTNVPIIRAYGWRVNLSPTDTTTLLSVGGNFGFASTEGFLGISSESVGNCGFAWIHSRKTAGGKTLVSSQRLIVSNSLLSSYTSEAAKLASMQSYGLADDVFITPDGTSNGSGTGASGSTSNPSGGSSSDTSTDDETFDPLGN